MTKRNQLYKCNVCGNIVSVNHAAGGELSCCSKSMVLVEAGVEDASIEKHVPFVNRTEEGIHVQIGAVLHPMSEEHYIEWITLVTDNKSKTVFLVPGDSPEAMFESTVEKVKIYAYCNLHGLWKLEM
ncbi:MAG: desulfoferrodoxin [Candidatus Moraniibacteriota bacterium]|jgi:superoxide reductase